jgi:hypothetical protein
MNKITYTKKDECRLCLFFLVTMREKGEKEREEKRREEKRKEK